MSANSQILIASRDNLCLHCGGKGFIRKVGKYSPPIVSYEETCIYCGGTGEGKRVVNHVKN